MTLIDVKGNRTKRLEEYKFAVKDGFEVSKAVKKVINSDIKKRFERGASSAKWAAMVSLINKKQGELRKLSHGKLGKISDRLEYAWYLVPNVVFSRHGPFGERISRVGIEEELKKKGLDPKIARFVFSSWRTLPKFGQGLYILTSEYRSAWEAVLRRDAQLSLALAVANFNIEISKDRDLLQGSKSSEASSSLYKETLNDVRNALRSESLSVAAITAELRLLEISGVLESKVLPAMAQTFRQDYRDSKTAEDSVKMANTLRELLWLSAVLKSISWRCMWPHIGDAAALVKASELPLTSKVQVPPRVTVNSIAMGGNAPSDYVEVLAIIENVDIRHEAKGKPITTFTIREPGENHRALAIVSGYKADSTGAVSGAAVLLRGRCKLGISGAPGSIQISREAIMKQRNSSFFDYLRAETYNIYTVIPHALSIQSSWVLGVNGPLNPIRYNVTAEGG